MSVKTVTRVAGPAAAALLAAGAIAATIPGSSAAQAAGVSAPEVFAGFRDSKPLVGLQSASSALQLPIGTYAISAKVTAVNNNGSNVDVNCRLDATTDFDLSDASLSATVRKATMSLQVTKVANSPKLIFLTCRNSTSAANNTLSFAKITAIRVADPNHLHNSPLL